VPHLIDLIPTIGLSLLAFIIAVLIIVTIHELGHYLVGRWRGIGADVFSIGFGPELISMTDRRGTRWRLAAIPFGGYVRFRGDASPASAPSGTRAQGTFEAASLWSRTLTIIAGPAANFVFAILVIAGYFLWSGIPSEEARVGALRPHPVPSELRAGDLVLTVGGRSVESQLALMELSSVLPPGQVLTWEVEREGKTVSVMAPRPMSPLVERVGPLTPAYRAGLLAGDVILERDGATLTDFSDLRSYVLASEGIEMSLLVWRDGQTREIRVSPELTDQPSIGGGFESRWVLGLSAGLPYEHAMRQPSLQEALWIGADRTWRVIHLTGSALSNIVTGAISHCNIRGVISMGEASGATAAQGAGTFVMFLALLSVTIGFMNLLPIPTLDGGHLALYAWEAVRGHAPSPRVTSAMMTVGMGLLIFMMVLGLINDLTC